MKFSNAVEAGYRNYFNFSGVAGRAEYWWFFLWYMLLWIVAALLVATSVVLKTQNPPGSLALTVIAGLFGLAGLATIIPGLSVQVRRLHDAGHSGWWVGVLLLLYALRLVLHAMVGRNPGAGLYLAVLVLAVVWLGVNIAIFVFLVQPSRSAGGGKSRY